MAVNELDQARLGMSGIRAVHALDGALDPHLISASGLLARNESGAVQVVADMDIDNKADLCAQLKAAGHAFLPSDDAHLLMRLYEEHGADFVRRLRGSFAFVLWDRRKRLLLLARDRFGIKPLYFTRTPTAVIVASSITSIFSHPGVPRTFSPEMLPLYFTFMDLPAPHTFFKGIERVPPASTVSFLPDGRCVRSCYWDVLADSPKALFKTEAECVDALSGYLESTVRLQGGSGQASGSLLSGGMDSSLITALAARNNKGLRTFTFGLSGIGGTDDRDFARKFAGSLRAQHHEIEVRGGGLEEGFLRRLVRRQEEPTLRPVSIPYHFLAEAVRAQQAGPIFIGTGADCLFGFPVTAKILRARPYLDLLARMPTRIQSWMMRMSVFKDPTGFEREILRRSRDHQALFWGFFNQFYAADIEELLQGDKTGRISGLSPYGVIEPLWNDFTASSYKEEHGLFFNYLNLKLSVPTYLMWVCRMGAQYGLRAKYPYLDHIFVECVFGNCGKFNRQVPQVKHLLRQVARKHIPEEFVNRKKCAGAGEGLMDVKRSLGSMDARAAVEAFNRRHGYFNGAYLGQLFSAPCSRVGQSRIWQLYIFTLWFEEWFEAAGRA